jgi:ABC-type nitrate/sulfonate/bicarbonate transport system ATPase subunit
MHATHATNVIDVNNVSKSFATASGHVQALERVSLRVQPHEFVSVIGPSGSGKSTLFNLVAGLERADTGSIAINGAEVSGKQGLVAYMPQRDALLPWRSVLDNAVLATEVQRGDVAAARQEARDMLEAFGLAGFGESLPAALSGGMRQRAALLRTVLWKKPVMLLDEPFGALDAITRAQLQQWLLGLWARLDRTVVLVTHDVDEAILLSDRVYVLTARPGRVVLDMPIELGSSRSYDIITTPEFGRIKAHLLDVLRQGMA